MTAAIQAPKTESVRYFAELTPMAEADTIGVTIGTTTFLHTVPAGGQSLHQALNALVADINADVEGYGASQSINNEFDSSLELQGNGDAVSLPVYVVA